MNQFQNLNGCRKSINQSQFIQFNQSVETESENQQFVQKVPVASYELNQFKKNFAGNLRPLLWTLHQAGGKTDWNSFFLLF